MTVSPDRREKTAVPLKQFLISQAYSTYNKGEVAIGISLIESIRSISPDAEISIMTPHPEQARQQYAKYNVAVSSRLFNTTSSYSGIRKISNLLQLIFSAFSYLMGAKISNFPMNSTNKAAIDLFRNADVMIIAGGGTFGGAKYRSFSGNLFPIYLAKKLGKKVMVYAPSVEPFTSKIVKVITKFALNHADVITAREERTFDLLKSLKLKTPLYLAADPAFLIGSEPLEVGDASLREAGIDKNENNFLIGMTIRDWDFPRENDSAIRRKRYIDAIQMTVEKLLRIRKDALIVIFTTSINVAFRDDDRITANTIRNSLKDSIRDRVYVLTRDYTPHQIKAMIGNMDVFISTRFHSTVFALSMNIPVMVIATELHKNRGVMEMMDLTDYTLDASSISPDNLFSTVNRLIEQRKSVAQQIKERIPRIWKRCAENEKQLKALVNE